ncbi:MAG: flagellar export chaperone FliS [Oscillospiraceae bacterium]|jgi:flagellar protein FliS
MNPYEKYQQQVVTTMTQGDMLLKLYDESAKQIEIARASIVAGKVEEMDRAISKAEEIIRYLKGILDYRYPVSANLAKLYDFFNTQLVMANVKKDVKHLDDIQPLILELRETFSQCVKIDRATRTSSVVGDVV